MTPACARCPTYPIPIPFPLPDTPAPRKCEDGDAAAVWYRTPFQVAKAGRLFTALPQNSDTSTYRLRSELALAQMELQRGELASPFERLLGLRPDVAKLPALTVVLTYYATFGTLSRRRGDAREAQSAKVPRSSATQITRPSLDCAYSLRLADSRLRSPIPYFEGTPRPPSQSYWGRRGSGL